MKLRLVCATAVLAFAVNAPVVRANVFSDPQSKIEKEQNLYEEAKDAYDDHNWRQAAREFAKVADLHGPQVAIRLVGYRADKLIWRQQRRNSALVSRRCVRQSDRHLI